MGCFDYTCECKGESCDHKGGQLWESSVIIEVPLSDGTSIYLEGEYEQYGYVLVNGTYKFYLKEFEEFFHGWLDGEPEEELSNSFVANKVWTVSEDVNTEDKFGDEISGHVNRHCSHHLDVSMADPMPDLIAKCIRADNGLNLETADQKQKKRIEKLKSTIEFMQKELGRLNRP
jgi:hypothetical protein